LHFPADVAGRSFEPILIHGQPPSRGTRGCHERSRAAADKRVATSACAMTAVKTIIVDMSFDVQPMTRRLNNARSDPPKRDPGLWGRGLEF
jgi:hypothetical protein